MKSFFEGEKRNVAADVKRIVGNTSFTVTIPERRVIDQNKAVAAGFDWGAASYDSATNKLLMLFDTTVAPLSALGTYYVQLRAVITPTAGSAERYITQIRVLVKDLGP